MQTNANRYNNIYKKYQYYINYTNIQQYQIQNTAIHKIKLRTLRIPKSPN